MFVVFLQIEKPNENEKIARYLTGIARFQLLFIIDESNSICMVNVDH